MAANSTGLFLFLDHLAEEGCKPSAVKMPGVDSVLPRSWMFANFQGMLQNQNSILEEVSAKILPPFPTVLPLFTVSIKCCSSAECSCSTFVCLKISKLKTHTLSYTEEQICLKQTASCFGGKDGSC